MAKKEVKVYIEVIKRVGSLQYFLYGLFFEIPFLENFIFTVTLKN